MLTCVRSGSGATGGVTSVFGDGYAAGLLGRASERSDRKCPRAECRDVWAGEMLLRGVLAGC